MLILNASVVRCLRRVEVMTVKKQFISYALVVLIVAEFQNSQIMRMIIQHRLTSPAFSPHLEARFQRLHHNIRRSVQSRVIDKRKATKRKEKPEIASRCVMELLKRYAVWHRYVIAAETYVAS